MRDFDEGLLKVLPTGSSLPGWLLEEECACQRRTAGTHGGSRLQQPVGEGELVKLVKLVGLLGSPG
jgi:hypothetical protein